MRLSILGAIMSLVPVGVSTDAQGISLSNFTPRIENLPAACQAAYVATIPGCAASDFPKNRGSEITCSRACVNGLLQITNLVDDKCRTIMVPSNSIIGVFLLGNGVSQLCGVEVVTESPSSTPATSARSTLSTQRETSSAQATTTEPSSSAEATSSTSDTASSSTATSAESTPGVPPDSPSSTGQGQLTIDTASPPPIPSQTPAPSPNTQKSNQDSGGGSPFDVKAAGSSSHVKVSKLIVAAMLGVAACPVFFFL